MASEESFYNILEAWRLHQATAGALQLPTPPDKQQVPEDVLVPLAFIQHFLSAKELHMHQLDTTMATMLPVALFFPNGAGSSVLYTYYKTTYHTDSIVNMCQGNKAGEQIKEEGFTLWHSARCYYQDDQGQRKEHPVERLASSAAHLTDD